MNAFITGTDTGVGKTYVTAHLIREHRVQGLDTIGFKPICCGSRDDAEILLASSISPRDDAPALTINEVNPVWLRTPAAPYVASLIENRLVDLALIRETFAALRARHKSILVEGAGGWLVPIADRYTFADLALELALPVIVVVKNRLGALNHAALTVHHIRAIGLECVGLILNHGPLSADADTDPQQIARATNRSVLEELLQVPVLREFPLAAGSSEIL
jgi:dethiobiotin synthetase